MISDEISVNRFKEYHRRGLEAGQPLGDLSKFFQVTTFARLESHLGCAEKHSKELNC